MCNTQISLGTLMARVLHSGPESVVKYSSLLGSGDGPFLYGDSGEYEFAFHIQSGISEVEATLIQRVGVNRLGQVIDVGAGGGRVTSWLQSQGVHAVACEPDPGWRPVHDHLGVESVLQVPIQEVQGEFDTAVCFGSSIPSWERSPLNASASAMAYLTQLARVLRPGGQLLLDIMNFDAGLPGLNPNFQRAHTTFTFGGQSADSFDLYPHRDTVDEMLRHLGFKHSESITTTMPMGTGDHHRWTAAYILE